MEASLDLSRRDEVRVLLEGDIRTGMPKPGSDPNNVHPITQTTRCVQVAPTVGAKGAGGFLAGFPFAGGGDGCANSVPTANREQPIRVSALRERERVVGEACDPSFATPRLRLDNPNRHRILIHIIPRERDQLANPEPRRTNKPHHPGIQRIQPAEDQVLLVRRRNHNPLPRIRRLPHRTSINRIRIHPGMIKDHPQRAHAATDRAVRLAAIHELEDHRLHVTRRDLVQTQRADEIHNDARAVLKGCVRPCSRVDAARFEPFGRSIPHAPRLDGPDSDRVPVGDTAGSELAIRPLLPKLSLRPRPETPQVNLLVEAGMLPADNEPDDAGSAFRADNEDRHRAPILHRFTKNALQALNHAESANRCPSAPLAAKTLYAAKTLVVRRGLRSRWAFLIVAPSSTAPSYATHKESNDA